MQLEEGETFTKYEPYGKYKIPITVSGENGDETTTNIYLDEPLRKIGEYADYVDFANQCVVRQVGVNNESVLYVLSEPTTEPLELSQIPTFAGTNVINISTTVKPSQMYVKYN